MCIMKCRHGGDYIELEYEKPIPMHFVHAIWHDASESEFNHTYRCNYCGLTGRSTSEKQSRSASRCTAPKKETKNASETQCGSCSRCTRPKYQTTNASETQYASNSRCTAPQQGPESASEMRNDNKNRCKNQKPLQKLPQSTLNSSAPYVGNGHTSEGV